MHASSRPVGDTVSPVHAAHVLHSISRFTNSHILDFIGRYYGRVRLTWSATDNRLCVGSYTQGHDAPSSSSSFSFSFLLLCFTSAYGLRKLRPEVQTSLVAATRHHAMILSSYIEACGARVPLDVSLPCELSTRGASSRRSRRISGLRMPNVASAESCSCTRSMMLS